jgi:hypothetical protein
MGQGGPPFAGGFVTAAQGQWTSDPAGQITQMGDLLVTSAKPTLTGSAFSSNDAVSYDAVVKRWLPVAAALVRPDGLAYAYAEPYKTNPSNGLDDATRIHVISLTDGTDRVIYSGAPRGVLAFQPEGIYTTAVRYYSEGATGLWLLDPSTGASTQLPNGGPFSFIGHGIAWTDHGLIGPTRLDKIEVSTGASQTWVNTQDEGWIWFVGLDSNGDPLVDVSQGTNSNWRLFVYTAPQVRTLLGAISVSEIGLSDSHGTWLAADDGIYLLVPGPKLLKVSAVTGGNVLGSCN